jgi:hypothetical protein
MRKQYKSASGDLYLSTSYKEDTIESAKAKAKTLGRVVVFPKANELFIDIDNPAAMRRFVRGVARFTGVTFLVRPSPSGRPGRHHVVVTMPTEVTPMERIALQSMLGSDPVRELLSWRRIQHGIEEPTLFFEHAS